MISYSFTHKNNVKLIKGDYFKPSILPKAFILPKASKKKVIVFDLDETIGHFYHLQIIYKCLAEILKRELSTNEFNTLLDLFPEFFRPGILTIFDFLYNKKKENHLYKLYIYTNNQCSEEWTKMIVNYIQLKIHSETTTLFDKIINAFKIKNKIIELKRTSNSKIYSDFIQCTMLPEDTIETCFIDNTYYDKMCNNKVYYILPKAYFHSLSKNTMINRVVSQFTNIDSLQLLLFDKLSENTHTSTTTTEVAITKKIMYLVREFLYYPKIPYTKKTRKNVRSSLNKKSRKQI